MDSVSSDNQRGARILWIDRTNHEQHFSLDKIVHHKLGSYFYSLLRNLLDAFEQHLEVFLKVAFSFPPQKRYSYNIHKFTMRYARIIINIQ